MGEDVMKRDRYMRLEDLPNIGPALAGDLRLVDVFHPRDLVGKDPYAMFDSLCRKTQRRHDPCVLDVFISAVRFMQGAPKRSWWFYTEERKKTLAMRAKRSGEGMKGCTGCAAIKGDGTLPGKTKE